MTDANEQTAQSALVQERAYWDRYYATDRLKQSLDNQINSNILSYFAGEFARAERLYRQSFQRPAQALILGSGTGTIAAWCNTHYPQWRVTAMDLSQTGLQLHAWTADYIGLSWSGHTLIADWDNLPFPPQTFDFVIADRALHHMLTPSKTLHHLAQTMKPAAILIGLREPSMAVSHPEMRDNFAAEAKDAGAHDHIWYVREWRQFFRAAGLNLKVRVHLEDCTRFFNGWGPQIPGLRRVLRSRSRDITARILYPYVWYYGSSRIAKYTLYAQK